MCKWRTLYEILGRGGLVPQARKIFKFESRKWHLQHSETRIIRKPRIPSARVCLFAGSAVCNIVNNKNHDQRHQKRIQNWESTHITSIPFPFLRTSFPIPSGQIPVPATQIPFSQSENRSIPVPILPLQGPLIMSTRIVIYPRADGAKRRARVLIPPGYLHPGKRKH